MSKICLIDFDETINSSQYPDLGEPTPGVKESLQEMKDMGYEIHILSCRTNPDVTRYIIDRQEQIRIMEKYLNEYKIPYDMVLNEYKPVATFYIDDRAIQIKPQKVFKKWNYYSYAIQQIQLLDPGTKIRAKNEDS